MKVIGERISILRKEGLLSVVILPTTDKKKLGLMFLWLMAWTVCGIIVFSSYFRVSDRDSKLFIIIYLSFWSYFEYNIIRAFIWKRFGREKLWIKNGRLFYQREVRNKGRIKEFDLSLLTPFQIIPLKNTSFSDSFYQSFWVKGGERIEFRSQSELVKLGMQLNDEEAKSVIDEVNKNLI